MPTKKQLQDEVDSIRAQLYQERQDHGDYVRQLKNTAYSMARESMRVKHVLEERDGYYECLQIVRFEEGHDGVNVVVANVQFSSGVTDDGKSAAGSPSAATEGYAS